MATKFETNAPPAHHGWVLAFTVVVATDLINCCAGTSGLRHVE